MFLVINNNIFKTTSAQKSDLKENTESSNLLETDEEKEIKEGKDGTSEKSKIWLKSF